MTGTDLEVPEGEVVDAEFVDEPFELMPDMVDLNEYTENVTMLVYGASGAGKSVFGGTANALIVATENGTVSAARHNAKLKGPKPAVKVIDCVHNFDKVKDTYEWLYEHAEYPQFPFDWVVIDTATEMQAEILRWVVNQRVEAGTAKSLNPYKTELQEYGEMHEIWRDYVKKFNDLPCNILWLAHEMTAEDTEGEEFCLPSFQGKGYQLASWTAAQMHVYGHMRVADRRSAKTGKTIQVREIQWRGTQKVRARDRFDTLPAKTVNKTLPALLKMIEDTNTVPDAAATA